MFKYVDGNNGKGRFNGDIGSWDTSNVTDMSEMFYRSKFNQNIDGWDVSKVTSMKKMFYWNSEFNQDLNSWDTSSVTDMSVMFYFAESFNGNISSWDTSSVTTMKEMFKMNSGDVFNQDLNSWDTSSVTDMNGMFYSTTLFNGNISSWDVSNVTDMTYMFDGAQDFNQDISGWDTSSVTSMFSMFNSNGPACDFNQDIGNWNVSSVTDFAQMFQYTTNFSQDLSGWCVENITNATDSYGRTKYQDFGSQGSNPVGPITPPVWGTCPAPSVGLTDTDADNYVLNSSVVTITATFSAAMSPTATISIGSVISDLAMTVVTSSTFRYVWDVDAGGNLPDAVYSATVSGVDTNSRAYIGTDSITFTLLSPPSTPSVRTRPIS